jgi:spore maturation protein CgeB
MCRHLRTLVGDGARASALAEHGRETILARHTCGHRVDELIAILGELGVERPRAKRISQVSMKELAE